MNRLYLVFLTACVSNGGAPTTQAPSPILTPVSAPLPRIGGLRWIGSEGSNLGWESANPLALVDWNGDSLPYLVPSQRRGTYLPFLNPRQSGTVGVDDEAQWEVGFFEVPFDPPGAGKISATSFYINGDRRQDLRVNDEVYLSDGVLPETLPLPIESPTPSCCSIDINRDGFDDTIGFSYGDLGERTGRVLYLGPWTPTPASRHQLPTPIAEEPANYKFSASRRTSEGLRVVGLYGIDDTWDVIEYDWSALGDETPLSTTITHRWSLSQNETSIDEPSVSVGNLSASEDQDIITAVKNRGLNGVSTPSSIFVFNEEQDPEFPIATLFFEPEQQFQQHGWDVGDLNGDGIDDLAITSLRTTSTVHIFLGPLAGDYLIGDANFAFQGDIGAVFTGHLNIGDTNNDGNEELLISGTDPFGEDRGMIYIINWDDLLALP